MIVSKNAENSIKLYIYIYIYQYCYQGWNMSTRPQVYLDNIKNNLKSINETRLNL